MDLPVIALGVILAGLVLIFVLRLAAMLYVARKRGASWGSVIASAILGTPIDDDRGDKSSQPRQ